MRMMGMKDSAYYASWMIYYSLQVFVLSLELTILTLMGLAQHSGFFMTFFFYFSYGMSCFGWVVMFT